MKRVITIFILIAFIITLVPSASAATAENTIQPQWDILNSVTADLEINWLGIATCAGRATAGEFVTVKVVVKLQQLTDTGWTTLKSWTVTDTQSAFASGTYAVHRGYTYRVSVTGYIYNSNGTLVETGTATDTFVY